MKSSLLLCLCLSLFSLPALAKKPDSPPAPQFERTLPDSHQRGQQRKKQRQQYQQYDETSAYEGKDRVYRSKKLRIHKHPPREGRYSRYLDED